MTTDAQNQAVTSLRITGTGVETDARQDQHEVGRLNPERDAVWSLRLAAVAESVQVFVDDEAYNRVVPLMECAANCFEYDAENNRIVIEPTITQPEVRRFESSITLSALSVWVTSPALCRVHPTRLTRPSSTALRQ